MSAKTQIALLLVGVVLASAFPTGAVAAPANGEGVYRVDLLVATVYWATPGEELTLQVMTFLDKYKPPQPGEPPAPLSPGDWVYIGNVPLSFEVKDEAANLVELNIPQGLTTDDNGFLEIAFNAPEKEGEYRITVYAMIEGVEYSDSETFTVSGAEKPPLPTKTPAPTPIPGIQLEVFNLEVWTNGTVSFGVRLHEYESQILEEVRINDLLYSWSDGSSENATILRDETRTWRMDVGSFNTDESVHVVVRATAESGSGYALAENPPTRTVVFHVKTDKTVYLPSESVIIEVENIGPTVLKFPDSALGLRILSIPSRQLVYGFVGLQVITEMQPGDRKVFTWTQTDSDGRQVSPGDYVAEARTLGSELIAEAAFTVSTVEKSSMTPTPVPASTPAPISTPTSIPWGVYVGVIIVVAVAVALAAVMLTGRKR